MGIAAGAIAVCLLLTAEFIPGQRPYVYTPKTGNLDIHIKVNVRHKDQTVTSDLLIKSIVVNTSSALDWSQVAVLVDLAIQNEMMLKAQELCDSKGCNK